MYTCEFCETSFTVKKNLIAHQKNAKYCLEKRGENVNEKFVCKYCQEIFTKKQQFSFHEEKCWK